MRSLVLNPPTLAFVVGTRAALAAGIALLVSEKLPAARRRAIGTALVAVGAATTVPAVISIMRAGRRPRSLSPQSVNRDEGLIGATRFPRKGDDDLE
jgi:hypothetical protein